MHVSADSLIAALRSAGHRVTAARRLVCEIVATDHADHLTAAAITQRAGGAVDQATVYRTLDALERAGALNHAHLGHGPSVYHLAGDEPHHHLICAECGRVVAFDPSLLDAASRDIRRATGFTVDASHFAMTGVCSTCRDRLTD